MGEVVFSMIQNHYYIVSTSSANSMTSYKLWCNSSYKKAGLWGI